MIRRALVLTALATFVAGTSPAADTWPQWRGPERDGKSASDGLMTSWPEGGPPLAWQAKGLGGGYSSVSLGGGHVYTMGDLEDGQYVLAVSRETGEIAWKVKVGPTWRDEYLGPRSTPAYDGELLFALSTEGDLYAFESATGKQVWTRSLPDDFGGVMMEIEGTDWKFAESPLVDGDKVLVTPGAADAAIVALDKRTGKTLWKTAIPELGDAGADGAAYSSIVISHGAGKKQYVQLLGRGVIGVDADTGRYLWGYNRVANHVANIPTPIIDGDHVFASTGYGTGAALLKLSAKPCDEKGGCVEAKEVYFLEADTMQNHHGGMILHDGVVYTGTGHNRGFPLAVEMATGEVQWGPERNDGTGSAAVAFADGHLYFRYQNGVMVLFEATPEEYREKGSFEIPNVVRESWAHPVIADGMLYLREQDALYVYDLRAKAQG